MFDLLDAIFVSAQLMTYFVQRWHLKVEEMIDSCDGCDFECQARLRAQF